MRSFPDHHRGGLGSKCGTRFHRDFCSVGIFISAQKIANSCPDRINMSFAIAQEVPAEGPTRMRQCLTLKANRTAKAGIVLLGFQTHHLFTTFANHFSQRNTESVTSCNNADCLGTRPSTLRCRKVRFAPQRPAPNGVVN